jgi:hypothetical protein
MNKMDLPKVEKGIPIYYGKAPQKNVREFLKTLEIGDSFVLDSRSLTSAYQAVARKIGIRLSSRNIADKKYRLWRID